MGGAMVLPYGVGYRDLKQMMGEWDVAGDHSTIYRWVQIHAREIETAGVLAVASAVEKYASSKVLSATDGAR